MAKNKMLTKNVFQITTVFLVLLFCDVTFSFKFEDDKFLPPENFKDMRTDEIIKFYGYPGEEHKVLTEDGYILSNFRLANPGGYPILLLHGMTATSDSFLLRGPRYDMSFLLWKRGYDVWMWNARGNIYSTEHVNMTYKDEKFFLFSIQEYGQYDTPASIDYILNMTGHTSVITIGHSNGCGNVLTMAALRPEYNDKVLLNIMWGQAVMLKYELFKGMMEMSYSMYTRYMNFDHDQSVMKKGSEKLELVKAFCNPESPLLSSLCLMFMGLVSGPNSNQTDFYAVKRMMTKFPAGSSMNAFKQMMQNMRSGEYKPLSYGVTENMRRYGTREPSPYPLGEVKIPTAMYYSCCNDFLSSKADNKLLKNKLTNVIKFQTISYKKFNHGDFLWAKDGYELLYKDVLVLIHKYTPSKYRSEIPIL
ncbi:hypothetical protein WDU94_011511 [Cyamophila willieti]